jgi:hypothetical protein
MDVVRQWLWFFQGFGNGIYIIWHYYSWAYGLSLQNGQNGDMGLTKSLFFYIFQK